MNMYSKVYRVERTCIRKNVYRVSHTSYVIYIKKEI